jgi:Fe-S-cluster containining protein
MSSLKEKSNSDVCAECGGKCCKFIMLETLKTDKYKIDFWEVQGNTKFSETDTHVQYGQKCPCQHIDENGRCDDYENRPQLCRDFPRRNLPRLWRNVCALWHERHKSNEVLKVF